MKFSLIAVSAATVLVQAVLPSAAGANQGNLLTSKTTPLKNSPEPNKVLAAASPDIDSSLVGDRKLVVKNDLRAGGISGMVQPGPSAPASGLVADEAATLSPLDHMANSMVPRLKSAPKTLPLKDSPEPEGHAPASADTSHQVVRRLGTTPYLPDNTGTMVSNHGRSVVYLRYGKIFQWGAFPQNNSPVEIPLTNITDASPVKVASGWHQNCVLLDNGKVVGWGNFANYGAIGDQYRGGNDSYKSPSIVQMDNGGVLQDLDGAVDIASGTHHSCVIKSNRSILCFGDDNQGHLAVNQIYDGTSSAKQVRFVATGGYFTCIVSEANEVRCYGREPNDDDEGHTASHPVTDISVGHSHGCYLMDMPEESDMNMRCFGINSDGELGNGGTSTTWTKTPVSPVGLDSKISSISCGLRATCAIKASDKSQWCWGQNEVRQLGVATTDTPVLQPAQVVTTGHLDQSLIRQIFSRRRSGHVLLTDGNMYDWGQNKNYLLGTGSTDQNLTLSGSNSAQAVFGSNGEAVPSEPADWQPPAWISDLSARTWDFEDGTMQGFELESGDCGTQPVEYGSSRVNDWDFEWTNALGGGTYYVNTYLPHPLMGGLGDLQVCAYADKTNNFQIESDTTITWQSRGHRICLKQLSDDAELVCKADDRYVHRLEPHSITSADLSSHVGKRAYLWFADESTNGWGHFQLDNVVVGNAAFGLASPTNNPTSAPTSTPSSSPSSAPTSTPTSTPSSGPTSAPTPTPTSAPTSAPSSSPVIPPPGPWKILHQDFSSDFTNSSMKDIASEFLIGKARDYETVLLDKDCQANITGIDITTTVVDTPHNKTYDQLLVQHGVNTSSIVDSSVWNATSNELEVCQIVRLILPASQDNEKMVIAEDIRQITIGFEMTADFNITAGLAAATISNATATTDVSSFVSAYKCTSSGDFTEDDSALGPNQGLSVCVVSTAPEVNVEQLVTMTAIQDDINLDIIQGGTAFINSLTSIEYKPSENGFVVTTRLPSNSFQFANDKSVSIQGEVEMKLADGGTRKLRVLVDAGIEGDEQASYALDVKLQEGDDVATDGAFAIGNSAIAAVALDKAFAFAAVLFFLFAS